MPMYSQEFKTELKKCNIFKIKSPKGGHYNDRFELNAIIAAENEAQLLNYLERLGVCHTVHNEEPKQWCPPPIVLNGTKKWIEYNAQCECFGYKTCVHIGTTNLTIEFNFNSDNLYEVSINDLKRAVEFEKTLKLNGFVS